MILKIALKNNELCYIKNGDHMKVTGIIVEYNPLHNGHIYHIEKSRELTQCDVLVAVMSGNFVQRGEPAIIDKWQRCTAALAHGVDLVIELPFIYCNQSAKQFAQAAVDILKLAQVDSIVFGSESNNIKELQDIADMSINVDNLKEALKTGIGFPKAYGLMAGEYYPNDILGIAYLKALKDSTIKAYSIQRTTNYHDISFDQNVASARAIRSAVFADKDINSYTPMVIDKTKAHNLSQYYPYIKTVLLTLDKPRLSSLFLFTEGIENHLIKQASEYEDFEHFINASVTKRYSRARIQRTLISLLCQIRKHEVLDLPKLDTIRVLGFNQTGQKYLKILKKNEVKIATRFNQIPMPYRKMEYRSSIIYHAFDQNFKADLKQELNGPIIINSVK